MRVLLIADDDRPAVLAAVRAVRRMPTEFPLDLLIDRARGRIDAVLDAGIIRLAALRPDDAKVSTRQRRQWRQAERDARNLARGRGS